jgi:hypothetical protein
LATAFEDRRSLASYPSPCLERKQFLLLAAAPEALALHLQRNSTLKVGLQHVSWPALNFTQGCRVFATSRRLDSMEALSALEIETLELDVTDIDAIRRVKAEISTRTGGKLDILVNNASVESFFKFLVQRRF